MSIGIAAPGLALTSLSAEAPKAERGDPEEDLDPEEGTVLAEEPERGDPEDDERDGRGGATVDEAAEPEADEAAEPEEEGAEATSGSSRGCLR
jgi:hypothetical protein